MNSKSLSQRFKGLTWGALVALLAAALIGVMAWKLIETRAAWGWPVFWGFAALGIAVAVVILHDIHETRRIRRVVAQALRGRPALTDEEFGRRFYEPAVAPVASRLRRLLAENLECDLAGMLPSDDFDQWLALSSGPDSAADSFFEELAIEFRLTRECRWPDRFASFDALARFVADNACAAHPPKTPSRLRFPGLRCQ